MDVPVHYPNARQSLGSNGMGITQHICSMYIRPSTRTRLGYLPCPGGIWGQAWPTPRSSSQVSPPTVPGVGFENPHLGPLHHWNSVPPGGVPGPGTDGEDSRLHRFTSILLCYFFICLLCKDPAMRVTGLADCTVLKSRACSKNLRVGRFGGVCYGLLEESEDATHVQTIGGLQATMPWC